VALDERESAIARLLDFVPAGLEEIDDGGEVELAVYVGVTGQTAICDSFPQAVVSDVEPGWEDRWREFHRPVRAGGVWLGPPWETPPAGVPSVVIDPGRAFGTGAHPTTRLCIELLAAVDRRGSLLDVGCGSGVLTIVAARLGYGPIVAIDDDPVAVEVARVNAVANGVVVDTRVADALRDRLPAADVAVANVLLAPVEAILARLEAATVVTSGYLAGEVPSHPGWSRVETRTLEGWAADIFVATG
jgi:ribosomal protein L11 methyltransferase